MNVVRFAQLLRAGCMSVILILFLCASVGAAPANLFEEYGDGGRDFEEIEIGNMLVYFHQRTIGEATVEKDYIVYQLDKDTGALLARKSHWRDDLPAVLPRALISREQAEARVEGEVQFSRLYIISPESDVFPLDPTPEHPCWVVRSIGEHGEPIVTVIDAVDGVFLGNGVPPPYTAFSLSGPWYFEPCSGAWSHSENAEAWFNTMGYSTEQVDWPTEAKVRSHIQSDETAMFFELAHGGSTSFASGCVDGNYPEYTYASEIEAWMVGYEKMPFAFIGSCAGMCSTGDGTFAYEFRKGSNENTTVVGYCGMSEEWCGTCWSYSIAWQDSLFHHMNLGWTVKAAFDQANADYPVCAGTNNCMRFAGDEDFAVVPPVLRAPAQMGACCVPFVPCYEDTAANCTAAGGTAQGAGTVCLGQRACCMDDGDCLYIDEICCDDEGGTPQGSGTVCLGDGNGDGIDEACDCDTCPGDMDRSGRVDFNDLDPFVRALLNDSSDDLCADVDDDGRINGRDVQPFVDRVLANGGAGTPC